MQTQQQTNKKYISKDRDSEFEYQYALIGGAYHLYLICTEHRRRRVEHSETEIPNDQLDVEYGLEENLTCLLGRYQILHVRLAVQLAHFD